MRGAIRNERREFLFTVVVFGDGADSEGPGFSALAVATLSFIIVMIVRAP